MEKIGLFPLNLVLFPESSLPLHIFEERYKQLIKHCSQTGSPFGLNLLDSGKMYDVGCSAVITDILLTYDDGRSDILVTGIKRYHLLDYSEGANLYYEAQVEYFDDTDTSLDEDLLRSCINSYNKVAETVKSLKIPKLGIELLNTAMPSFLIAQKAGLTNIQKQKMLEMSSELERLEYLYQHLNRIIPLLEEGESISRIIKNDGYFRPNT